MTHYLSGNHPLVGFVLRCSAEERARDLGHTTNDKLAGSLLHDVHHQHLLAVGCNTQFKLHRSRLSGGRKEKGHSSVLQQTNKRSNLLAERVIADDGKLIHEFPFVERRAALLLLNGLLGSAAGAAELRQVRALMRG